MIWAKIVEIVSLDCVSTIDFQKGSPEIRGQLLFPVVPDECDFVPKSWNYSFVYPGVKTEYNFVTAIPRSIAFVRMRADFEYLGRKESSHHAAKILAVNRLSFSSGKEAPPNFRLSGDMLVAFLA